MTDESGAVATDIHLVAAVLARGTSNLIGSGDDCIPCARGSGRHCGAEPSGRLQFLSSGLFQAGNNLGYSNFKFQVKGIKSAGNRELKFPNGTKASLGFSTYFMLE